MKVSFFTEKFLLTNYLTKDKPQITAACRNSFTLRTSSPCRLYSDSGQAGYTDDDEGDTYDDTADDQGDCAVSHDITG